MSVFVATVIAIYGILTVIWGLICLVMIIESLAKKDINNRADRDNMAFALFGFITCPLAPVFLVVIICCEIHRWVCAIINDMAWTKTISKKLKSLVSKAEKD